MHRQYAKLIIAFSILITFLSSLYHFKRLYFRRGRHGEVIMVTASSGMQGMAGIPELKNNVYENRASYAQRWGYEFVWANITSYSFGAELYWNKIPILRDVFVRFPNAEWVWWLDLDIIIMTPSINIHSHLLSTEGMLRNLLVNESIVGVGGGPLGFNTLANPDPDDMNFIIAQDRWGQNVGSFLMRRGLWTDWILEMWTDPLAIAQHWTFPENDGWTHLFRNHQIVRDHVAIVNQRALNAYPSYNKLGESWNQGDLLVHFAGCGNHTDCPEHWSKMWQQREKYSVDEWINKEISTQTTKIEAMQKI